MENLRNDATKCSLCHSAMPRASPIDSSSTSTCDNLPLLHTQPKLLHFQKAKPACQMKKVFSINIFPLIFRTAMSFTRVHMGPPLVVACGHGSIVMDGMIWGHFPHKYWPDSWRASVQTVLAAHEDGTLVCAAERSTLPNKYNNVIF